MPDADLDQVVADLTGAASGGAGERCMAANRSGGTGSAVVNAKFDKCADFADMRENLKALGDEHV